MFGIGNTIVRHLGVSIASGGGDGFRYRPPPRLTTTDMYDIWVRGYAQPSGKFEVEKIDERCRKLALYAPDRRFPADLYGVERG